MSDEKKNQSEPKGKLIAKKDFRIVQNEHDIVIRKGDVLDGVPKQFLENLRTEGVL
jgi:hypothetical protein